MIIDDKIYISKHELGSYVQEFLELFIYSNPEYYTKKRLKLSVRGVSDKIYFYNLKGDTIVAPRGALPKVRNFLKEKGLPVRVLDKRIEHPPIDVDLVTATTLEDQQTKIIDTLNEHNGGLIEMLTGGGKCLQKNTKIIMYDGGLKKVQDIIPGDLLMGDDSLPRKVLSTSKGKGPLVKVIQNRGEDFICNDVHILTLKYTNISNKRIHKLSNNIIDISIPEYTLLPKSKKHWLKCFKVSIDFPDQETNIDPYFLGVWLSEGNNNATAITTADNVIKDECYKQAEKYNLDIRVVEGRGCETLYLTSGNSKARINKLLQQLKAYNLVGNKHIPQVYLSNSKINRLQLLAGLIDTDGYTRKEKDMLYIAMKDTQLIHDIAFLSRSLGFYVSKKNFKVKNYPDNNYVKLTISGNLDTIPLKVGHKKCNLRRMNKDHLVTGFKLEDVGIGDYYGFTLDGNGRFLLEDFTVTHNTIAALGYIAEKRQPTLILVHLEKLQQQWIQEIKAKLVGDYTIGVIKGSKKVKGDITVALIQSAYNMYEKDPTYFDEFGIVITDECHKVGSPTFSKLLNNLKAKYRIGITATATRKDGMHILLYDVIGEIVLQIGGKELNHRVTTFDFKIVDTDISMPISTRTRWTGKGREEVIDITGTIGELTANVKRNNLIIKTVIETIEDGHYPLVLSDRVAHNELLHEELTRRGYKSVLIIGKHSKKIDMEEIRFDKTIQVIISNIAMSAEGLDIPRLSCVHITTITSNMQRLTQIIGRIRRIFEGKKLPLVVDYRDNLAYTINESGVKNFLLKNISYKRIKHYRALQDDY